MFNRYNTLITTIGAIVSAAASFLWGAPDTWIMALVTFMVADYLSGVAAAYINKEISSLKGFKGILKKLLMMLPVAVGHMLDKTVGTDGALRGAAIGFLMANEGISVLENCARAGVPIPRVLLNTLIQVKNDTEGE